MTEPNPVQDIEQRLLPLRRPALPALAEELAKEVEEVQLSGPFTLRLGSVVLDRLGVEASDWRQRENDRSALVQAVLAAGGDDEQRTLLAKHLSRVTGDPLLRKRRTQALREDLDLEGVLDLEAMELARSAQRLQGLMDVLSTVAASAAVLPGELANRLLPMSDYPFWDVVRRQALRCLASSFDPELDQVDEQQFKLIQDLSERDGEDPRVQAEAIGLRFKVDAPGAAAAANQHLLERRDGDAFLLRAQLLEDAASGGMGPVERLPLAEDPSEHVRQTWARSMARARTPAALARLSALLEEDPSPRVRGAAVKALAGEVRTALEADGATLILTVWSDVVRRALSQERDDLVLQCVLEALHDHAEQGEGTGLVAAISAFASETESSSMSMRAAAVLLELEAQSDATLHARRETLRGSVRETSEGTELRIDVQEDEVLPRALLTSSPEDFQLSLRRAHGGLRLARGSRRIRRFWRMWFEWWNARPDKRQDTLHTTGRKDGGFLVVPPVRLAEVTQSKVPGERRLVSRLGHWAPFLPRVDDFLETLEARQDRTMLSPAGSVRISPPEGAMKRWRARLALTRHYAHYAALREASLDAENPSHRGRFLVGLRELGFVVTYRSLRGRVGEQSFDITPREVGPYFRGSEVSLPVLFDGPFAYFLEDQANLPSHLLWLIVVVLGFLVFRSVAQRRQISGLVDAIPWVIGGWGTRGKSGTERLKAGLFQGLGLDVWAKTTGCEAMVIHGIPTRPAHEVFLYRPYDKPTIWEQVRVLEISRDAGAQVFLWECMALNPRYVSILTHEWMRPQISTITNAYPDHEDVQGPTGEDVARVIASFAPRKRQCFTAEDQMLPILREQARRVGSALTVVTPTDADLLPEDLLARFPYQEHPRNILLVARMAESLGVPQTDSIVAMADWVVPDLGVLKTYPEIDHRMRRLFFTNGMSANERAGCLSNWERLNLHAQNDPRESIVTVVNNRWDRIPRSRVFAKILVEDISADAHVLIGSNLNGLQRFIQEELDLWLAEQRILPRDVSQDAEMDARGLEAIDSFFGRLRIPIQETAAREAIERVVLAAGASRVELLEQLGAVDLRDVAALEVALEPIVSASVESSELGQDVLAWALKIARRFADVDQIRARFLAERDVEKSDGDALALYRLIFLENVHVVEQVQATGDQVIDHVSRAVPPGNRAHLIGLQNIKGTGLDFVYRWLSIERITSALADLQQDGKRKQALILLGSYTGYGLFDCRLAKEALSAPLGQLGAEETALWQRAAAHVDGLEETLSKKLSAMTKSGPMERACNAIERWVDPLDSIHRAWAARRVQNTLALGCISQGRAAEKMRAITSRDKGGWLYKTFRKLDSWVRARVSPRTT